MEVATRRETQIPRRQLHLLRLPRHKRQRRKLSPRLRLPTVNPPPMRAPTRLVKKRNVVWPKRTESLSSIGLILSSERESTLSPGDLSLHNSLTKVTSRTQNVIGTIWRQRHKRETRSLMYGRKPSS